MSGGASLWPTPAQEMLLRAAVGPEAKAAEAFIAWKRMIDLDVEIDLGTYGLLPLLYDRLSRLGVSDPLMGRLKGIYRRSWYETHALMHATAPVVAALEARGIATLLLKGVPLALSWYPAIGLRRMADLDLAVRPEQARDAIAVLNGLGWIRDARASDEALQFRHSMLFRRPDGYELDLHWHIMFEACTPAADAGFWGRAQPLDMRGVATRRLAPADMLLHTVIHGLRANRWPPIRWIPDALAVLHRDAATMDWDGMVGFARSNRLTCRLGLGLRTLAHTYGAPVPPPVLSALRAAGTSVLERIENSVVLRDTERLYDNAVTKQWVIFADYCRVARRRDPVSFVIGFTHYLRYRWNLEGRREIVPVMLRGMARRLVSIPR
jgi:hypothetical protein